MVHESALGVEFFASLFELDEQIAGAVAAGGCPRCGGPLHRADYPRKPRGALVAAAAEAFTRRHSLCCGRAGCRARALPPSVRFLGRRVYVGAVVLFASMAAQAVGALRVAQSVTGVPRRTLRRWTSWWTDLLPATATWAELRARFVPPPPVERELPASLVERVAAALAGVEGEATLAAVAWRAGCLLAPVTTLSVSRGARFLRGVDHQAGLIGGTQKMA